MNWKVALILAVTAGFLVVVLWGLDLDTARADVRGFAWWVIVPSCACYFGSHLCRCWRMRILLDRPLGLGRLLVVNSIGFLAINVVPLRLGEFVRPWLFFEQDRIPFGESLAAVFVERLLDVLMLLVLLLLVGLLVPIPPEGVRIHGVDVLEGGIRMALALLGVGALASIAVVVSKESAIRWFTRPVAWFSPSLAGRIASLLRSFRLHVATLARRPVRAILVLGLSAATWACTIAGVRFVYLGTDFAGLGFRAATINWGITLAAMTAVPTPGFFGPYEAASSAALRLVGLDADHAVTLAVITHVGQFGFTVAVGMIFLVGAGLSLREVVRRSQAAGRDVAGR
ncbi:MAG: flippase-like domain-containing protein [Deltaproteobacteria bacterium]|nr:flippase-like domain-containing protein [Deltaproteobacteria bacterium]